MRPVNPVCRLLKNVQICTLKGSSLLKLPMGLRVMSRLCHSYHVKWVRATVLMHKPRQLLYIAGTTDKMLGRAEGKMLGRAKEEMLGGSRAEMLGRGQTDLPGRAN